MSYVIFNKICLLFADDQKWYRAVVIECAKDSFYEVAFVDSGRVETLHKDSLRKMEKKFMSLAIQIVMCTLKGS